MRQQSANLYIDKNTQHNTIIHLRSN